MDKQQPIFALLGCGLRLTREAYFKLFHSVIDNTRCPVFGKERGFPWIRVWRPRLSSATGLNLLIGKKKKSWRDRCGELPRYKVLAAPPRWEVNHLVRKGFRTFSLDRLGHRTALKNHTPVSYNHRVTSHTNCSCRWKSIFHLIASFKNK